MATAAVAWFATTVPLGSRTLLGHLLAIAGTPEAKELGKGVEEAAKDASDRARQTLREHRSEQRAEQAQQVANPDAPPTPSTGATPTPNQAPAPATDRLNDADRRALDKLVRERTQVPAAPATR